MKNSEYRLKLTSSSLNIEPNQQASLTLTPESPFELETTHERKIHLIIVSEDLSFFNHVHPEPLEDKYRAETKFPSAGKYLLFADYKPMGNDHVVDKFDLQVQGNAPDKKKINQVKLTGASGPFSISLVANENKFTTGHLMLDAVLSKEGKTVDPSTLDDYLGAKAHVVIIGFDDKQYIHVHPMVEEGKYKLHISIPGPGLYKAWLQFQVEGTVHTTDFVIDVTD